jgi:hypothetical protein
VETGEPAAEEAEPPVAEEAEPEPVAGEAEPEPAGEGAERASGAVPNEDGGAVAEPVGDGPKVRLGSGQLREKVLSHLREHLDQDFTPSAMGKVMARSSGAISNACDRLMADGLITRTSGKPRRYRFAAWPGGTGSPTGGAPAGSFELPPWSSAMSSRPTS